MGEEKNVLLTKPSGRKAAPFNFDELKKKPWQISAEPAYLRSAHASPL